MHDQIKPGAYRALFLDALATYRTTAPVEEHRVIDHYTALLRNPEYKFGCMTGGTSSATTYRAGDLFFRS